MTVQVTVVGGAITWRLVDGLQQRQQSPATATVTVTATATDRIERHDLESLA